jgi:hypothetical protein
MADPLDNTARMQAAVTRWIAEAQGRSDGARLLASKATWMGHQIRMLGDPRIRTPQNMEGVEAADALDAQARIVAAARALKKAQAMKVAA